MFHIVAVCTANVCRSPLAELLLAARLDAERFTVLNAGVRARDGVPMDPEAVRQAHRLGFDGVAGSSRRITPSMIDAAGLILTATRAHRADVLGLRPAALRRAFTLTEFADLMAFVPEGDPVSVVSAAAERRSQTGLRSPEDFDLPDPYREPYEVHARVATRIFDATQVIAARLGGVSDPR